MFEAQKIAANNVASNFSVVQQTSANKKIVYDLMISLR